MSENQCPGDSEKSTTESWPCLRLVPEQRASVDGGRASARCHAGTVHAFPVESHVSSRSAGSVLQRNGEEKVTQPEGLATQQLLDFFFFAPKQKRLQWAYT